MKFLHCKGTTATYNLRASNNRRFRLRHSPGSSSGSNIQLLEISRIPESGEIMSRLSSSYESFNISENENFRDSGISLTSNLSESFTDDVNELYDECVEEASSDEGSVSLQNENYCESVSNLFCTNSDQAGVEEMKSGRKLNKCYPQINQYSNVEETPRAHLKKVVWRRPFQNIVNFQLSSYNDDNRFGRVQLKDPVNSNNVRMTSLKHTLDNSVSVPYNLEEISLWPKNQLPETLHVDYSLKTLEKPQVQSGAFKSISSHELARTMESMNMEVFSKRFIVVDCRYPYEYNGGHVKSAINVWNWKTLRATFYPDCPAKFKAVASKIPIFYCEFSQKRGPQLAEALRRYDRKRNEWRYPEVDYKEVYLLDGGYKKFFEDQYTHLCEPASYVTMLATPYRQDLKRFHMHRSKSAVELNAAISGSCDNPRYVNCGWVRHSSCLLGSPTQFLQTPGLLKCSDGAELSPTVCRLRLSESPEPAH